MATDQKPQKVVIVGAGPVGSLAALYAAQRGHDVEIYELRNGQSSLHSVFPSMESNKYGQTYGTLQPLHSTSPSPSTWPSLSEASTLCAMLVIPSC
jgi:2-polyprenyl-6-methoxyphenol hydroxylase-like FAD-dependent oxidoreductase